jgi:hypothetical protein
MTPIVYNLSVSAGVVLVSVGAGMVYLPAGLIVGGALVLAMTVFAARSMKAAD